MNEKTAIKQLNYLKKYHKNMRLAAESWISDFETLIAIILSARTKDETTIRIAKKLFESYSSPERLGKAKLEDIKSIIKPINFYQNKAKNIIACSKDLSEKYNGEIPRDFEKLIELRGVGRKTANVFLSEAGFSEIGVDTHVSYISQKLGWTKNNKPEKIEKDLKELFPKSYWKKLNPTLVRFGKSYPSKKQKDKLLEEIKNKT